MLLSLISSENAAYLDALPSVSGQKARQAQAAGPGAALAVKAQAEQAPQTQLAEQGQAATSWQRLLAGLQRWWRQLFA